MSRPRTRVWVAKHHFPAHAPIEAIVGLTWEQILVLADRPRSRDDELLLLDQRNYQDDLRREFELPPSRVPEI